MIKTPLSSGSYCNNICFSNAEGEVSGLRSRLILLQEHTERQEERLAKATLDLAGACRKADNCVKKRHELENANSSNEEGIDNLEKQLKDAVFLHTESERKFEDISRKMATLEADGQRGNERADGAEKKIMVNKCFPSNWNLIDKPNQKASLDLFL